MGNLIKLVSILFGILLVIVILAMIFIPASSVGMNPQQTVATVSAEANHAVDNASQSTGVPAWLIWVGVIILVIILFKFFFH